MQTIKQTNAIPIIAQTVIVSLSRRPRLFDCLLSMLVTYIETIRLDVSATGTAVVPHAPLKLQSKPAMISVLVSRVGWKGVYGNGQKATELASRRYTGDLR